VKGHSKTNIILGILACTCLLISSLFAGTVAAQDWDPVEMCHPWEEWENYQPDCGSGGCMGHGVCGDNWYAQPFTAVDDHCVNDVSLMLFKLAKYPVNDDYYLTVAIMNTDSGLPVGPPLGTGGMYASEVTCTYPFGDWVGTSIDEVQLEEGVTYAIVVRFEGDCAEGAIYWCLGENFIAEWPTSMPDGLWGPYGTSWTPISEDSSFGFKLACCGEEEEEAGFIPLPLPIQPKPFEDNDSSWSMPPQVPATPSYVKILTASVQPSQVIAGEPVTILANVKNSGDMAGNFTAELTINGQLEDSRNIAVAGNASTPVNFTVVKDKPGTYTVDIGGQKAYFTVVEGLASNTINIMYVILGCLVLLAVALGVILAMRKGFAK
jgi:hypothetical protein